MTVVHLPRLNNFPQVTMEGVTIINVSIAHEFNIQEHFASPSAPDNLGDVIEHGYFLPPSLLLAAIAAACKRSILRMNSVVRGRLPGDRLAAWYSSFPAGVSFIS
jgi:hypothetical protein